jgi:hypothetical protein
MVTLIAVLSRMRNRLTTVVAGWLVLQLAVLCAAPLAQPPAPVDAGAEACSCPDGMPADHCPMHADHDLRQSPARCAMRSSLGEFAATLMTLLTPGFPPLGGASPFRPEGDEPVAAVVPHASSRSELPDSPPPRF